MTGVIEGGWEYVVAAYVVTVVFFGGYLLTLWARYRAATRKVSSAESESRNE
jgi:hypothetical protein